MKIFNIDFKAAVKPVDVILFAGVVNVSANFKNAVQGLLNANTGKF